MSARKSLEQYNSKRNFTLTREPEGDKGKAGSGEPIFVVQKHAATRLHWDFRLEMNGVLKSWAVTNEPVADPSIKRLAVKVEDHPLSYAAFEGDIPKGQYGGGHVDIWDKGIWKAEGNPQQDLKKGKLSFTLKGRKMKGLWHLVRMNKEGKRENWLLIKGSDEYSDTTNVTKKQSAIRPVPKAVLLGSRKKANIAYTPELATRVEEAPDTNEWLHEIKLDGYRALLDIRDKKVSIITRNGLDWTERFPDIAAEAEKLKVRPAQLDGEIIVYNEAGISDFSLLQQTLSGTREDKMYFVAFDLLRHNGKDCKQLPLEKRKQQLKKLLQSGKPTYLRYHEHVEGKGERFLEEAKKLHLEGIVSKKRNSTYEGGRNKNWLKIKIDQEEEFVIAGLVRRSDNPERVGAVLLAQYEKDKLVYKGKSGTGFPEAVSNDLLVRAQKLFTRKQSLDSPSLPKGNIEWLKPSLVAMVRYTSLTKDGLLRHAVFRGLREDKKAKEVKPEKVSLISEGGAAFNGIPITHPERVVFPVEGYTKGDVAAYYSKVAGLILPYLTGRPVSIIRCPDGLNKSCFFQRHLQGKAANFITQLAIKDEDSGEPYFSVDTPEALLSLVQFGALEFHPWGSKAPHFDKADRIVFDLDPDPRINFPSLKAAAFLIRERLKKQGLKSFVKTTGGKGLHIVVPIRPAYTWPQVKSFSKNFATELETTYPEAFTTHTLKAQRSGKIFIDYLRNDATSTSVAPFSLRAREGAPLSMPMSWARLKSLRSLGLMDLTKARKTKLSDAWRKLDGIQQDIPVTQTKKR